jgi:hypothetical protein
MTCRAVNLIGDAGWLAITRLRPGII